MYGSISDSLLVSTDRDDAPPPRNQVYLAACNASDPYQQWEGSTFSSAGAPSTIKNLGNGECLNATIILPDGSNVGQNPMMVSQCDAKSTKWQHNSNGTITTSSNGNHGCINVQNGDGPDIDIWDCHPPGAPNAQDDQFVFSDHQIKPTKGVSPSLIASLITFAYRFRSFCSLLAGGRRPVLDIAQFVAGGPAATRDGSMGGALQGQIRAHDATPQVQRYSPPPPPPPSLSSPLLVRSMSLTLFAA